MKRGANTSDLTEYESAKKKSKEKEDTSTTSAFDIIPNEIFNHIISFLPSYCLFGNNSIGNVCSRWNNNIKSNQISSDSIVESCRSKEDAINILKDKNIFENLTFNLFVKIIRWLPEVVERILQIEDVIHELTPKQLAVIGSHSEPNIKAVYAVIPSYVKYMSMIPDMANIINLISEYNPELFKKHIPWGILRNNHHIFFITTAINSLPVAEYLYAGKELGYDDLTSLMKTHVSIAEQFLQKQDQVLDIENIITIASYHDKTADALLQNPDYKSKLGFIDEVKLARGRTQQLEAVFQRKHITTSNLIKEYKAALIQMCKTCRNLSMFLQVYVEKAESTMEPDLLLFIVQLGCIWEEIAKRLISQYSEKLNEIHLVALGGAHASVAAIIVNTPKLLSKLNIDQLVRIGSYNKNIAMHIVENASISSMLNMEQLVDLGSSDYAVARKIFHNPLLNKIIDPSILFLMIFIHKENVIYLLKSECDYLFKHIEEHDLRCLCNKSLKFSSELLKIERLSQYHHVAKDGLLNFAVKKHQEFSEISFGLIDQISDIVKTEPLTKFKSKLQSIYQEVENNINGSIKRPISKMS